MQFLRNILDRIETQVKPGAKFEKLKTSFYAFDSFLFVPNKVTSIGTHIKDGIDLKRTMMAVIIAMIPAMLFGMWNVGHQHFLAIGELIGRGEGFWDKFVFGLQKVLPIIIVCYTSGLAVEFIFATLRKEPVNEGFLVTGMVIPIIMPSTIPLWMVAVATIFAVVIAKEAFGGTGMNILNVALTARAFVFFAYPKDISGDKVWIDITLNEGEKLIDGFSGATPLANAVFEGKDALPSLSDMFFGFMPGSIAETSTLAILLGGIFMVLSGIASWRIMISVIMGGYVMGMIFNIFAVNSFMEVPALYHLCLGGFMYGAIFMAGDPVTAAQTSKGKYIYGFLVGMFAILIRVFNPAYPEGMMLAILLMNVFAPLIDHYVIKANMKKRLSRV